MRTSVFSPLLALVLAVAIPVSAKEAAHDETLILYGQRSVTVTVPAGFVFSSNKDDRGLITAQLTGPKEMVSLRVSFLPDPENDCATSRGRKELMAKSFQLYVSGSVEQAMRFEELEPRSGGGTYCVFTDASLAGKTKLPAGEYLHSTTGIKAWPGAFALFTIFSHNTTGDDYRTAMKVLRESLRELPLTPLR